MFIWPVVLPDYSFDVWGIQYGLRRNVEHRLGGISVNPHPGRAYWLPGDLAGIY
jgi:hypothetical protein